MQVEPLGWYLGGIAFDKCGQDLQLNVMEMNGMGRIVGRLIWNDSVRLNDVVGDFGE